MALNGLLVHHGHSHKGSHTTALVGHIEEFAEGRLTDVKTEQRHLLTQQGKADRKVGGIEGLTLTRSRRSEENHLLSLLQHKLDVGTERAEDFVHLAVLVLLHHDAGRTLGCFACHCHIGHDGDGGEACHILMTLNLIAHHLDEIDYQQRQTDAQHQCYEHDDHVLGTHLSLIDRFVDEFSLVGCSGQ